MVRTPLPQLAQSDVEWAIKYPLREDDDFGNVRRFGIHLETSH
jgi:hypothetical protein